MRRADQIFSIVLMMLGAFVTFESWRMPRFEELHVQPMTAPGLTPALIGIIILVLGAILFGQSVWSRRAADEPAEAEPVFADPADAEPLPVETSVSDGYRRVLLVLIITFAYAAGLVGRIPFWLATGLFVFAFVFIFEADNGKSLMRRFVAALLMGGLVSAAVTWLFQEVFLVRLP